VLFEEADEDEDDKDEDEEEEEEDDDDDEEEEFETKGIVRRKPEERYFVITSIESLYTSRCDKATTKRRESEPKPRQTKIGETVDLRSRGVNIAGVIGARRAGPMRQFRVWFRRLQILPKSESLSFEIFHAVWKEARNKKNIENRKGDRKRQRRNTKEQTRWQTEQSISQQRMSLRVLE
jgi:hypothetical protein